MAISPQTNATLAEIADVIRDADDFVLCGHVSPDGDCLGSQLALWHAIKALGKRATCVLVRDEPIDASLAFMPGASEMVAAELYEGTCQTFIGLDVPSRERIGEAACKLLDAANVSITIDHHACETTMCQHVYVDPDAASASMMVWELVKLLIADPPIESALCAYVGLLTDTGGFRFQNSDAAAFAAASDLVSWGVDPASVATQVYQNRSIASLKLEALAIERLQVLSEGGAAMSWVCNADLERLAAGKSDVEPLVDAVRSVQGTRVACMLREQDGKVRGNLRAKDDTDVSALARKFGGGGHKAAAGFTLDMPIEEALLLMQREIEDLLQ